MSLPDTKSRLTRSRRKQRTAALSAVLLATATVWPATSASAAGDPPQVFDTFASGTTERPIAVFLSGFDPDGETITYSVDSGPANGVLTDDCSDGICTYTSDVGFVGTDSFTYSASDGDLTSGTATATIDVIADAPPTVFDGFSTTKVDAPVAIFLSAFDPNGDAVTFAVDTAPANGTLDDCSAGSCTYTPDTAFFGTDSFTFTGSDGVNASAPATYTIDVQVDLPPDASDQTVRTKIGRAVDLSVSASDPNGDPLTYSVESGPSNGTLTDCTFGFCTYTPDAGFSGIDSFTFSASDGVNVSAPATVSVEVSFSTLQATPLTVSGTPGDLAAALAGTGVTISNVVFTGDDRAAGTFVGGAAPIGFESGVILSSGAATGVSGPNLGDGETTALNTPGDADLTALAGVQTFDATVLEFDLVPDSNQLVFDYVFSSEEYNEFVNSSFNDVFAFFVNGVNCAVVGTDPVSINTINNGNPFDTDPRQNPSLFINNDLDDGGGSIDTEMDGLTVVLTCIAEVNAGEVNSIKLAIADGSDSILDSAVFLAQGSFQANTAPSADPKSVVTDQDVPVGVILSGSDPEGDALTFAVAGGPSNGVLTGTPPALTYTPNPGYVGPDSFTYVANDGALDSSAATVSITVNPVSSNDPPVVSAGDDGSGVEGSPVGLAGSASDPDGDTLTLGWSYTADGGVDAGASCSFSAPGSASTDITCTDDGTFTVTLTADDGVNPPVSASATVTLANADPSVSITAPSDGASFVVGSTVSLSADLADAGANDTHTCSIDWGDGTVTAGAVAAGACTGSHSYGAAGPVTVTVTATDDDTGIGTDSIGLTLTDTPPATGKVTGDGWLWDQNGNKVEVKVRAVYRDGELVGRLKVDSHQCWWLPASNCVFFTSTTVENLVVSGDTATFDGEGKWKKKTGYTYEVTVSDTGKWDSPLDQRDTFTVVVRDAAGTVVYSASNRLVIGDFKVR